VGARNAVGVKRLAIGRAAAAQLLATPAGRADLFMVTVVARRLDSPALAIACADLDRIVDDWPSVKRHNWSS
jgi:hypothetical protein